MNIFPPLEICQLNAHRKARAVAIKISRCLLASCWVPTRWCFWAMKLWASRADQDDL